MMKMNFKWILLAMTSLVVSFTVVSCNDDNGGKKEIFDRTNLTGEWYLSIATGYMVAENGSVGQLTSYFTKDDATVFMVFDEYGDLLITSDGNETYLKWELNGDKLKLTDPEVGSSDIYTVKKLNATTLHYQALILDEYVNNYTYTKIER